MFKQTAIQIGLKALEAVIDAALKDNPNSRLARVITDERTQRTISDVYLKYIELLNRIEKEPELVPGNGN